MNFLFKTEEESNAEEKSNGKVAAKKDKIVKAKPAKARPNEQVFKHQLLAATLKAHSESIESIDFSPNGKYLISCGEGIGSLINKLMRNSIWIKLNFNVNSDRAIFLWKTKDLENVSSMKWADHYVIIFARN